MKMDITEDDGVVKIGLVGRLDTPGVDAIETRFTEANSAAEALANPTTAPQRLMAIGVFQAMPPRAGISVGCPFSQSTIARALSRRKGKMILYAPQPFVAQVLETASLGDIIPVQPDAASAVAAAKA